MAAGPRIDILSIQPGLVEGFLEGSLLGRAIRAGKVVVRVSDIRAYAQDKHNTVDGSPYGGGDGLVLRCEPTVEAVEAVAAPGARILAMSPRGRRLDHALARELATQDQLVLICGRYAGLDERILQETGAEELSIGDYVLSGGEIAALAVTEVVTRLLPGVLGNPESAEKDSFADGLLEHPLYTRPAVYRGRRVPDVLVSGNHGEIERRRRRESLQLTLLRRPELLDAARLTDEDRKVLRELRHETDAGHR